MSSLSAIIKERNKKELKIYLLQHFHKSARNREFYNDEIQWIMDPKDVKWLYTEWTKLYITKQADFHHHVWNYLVNNCLHHQLSAKLLMKLLKLRDHLATVYFKFNDNDLPCKSLVWDVENVVVYYPFHLFPRNKEVAYYLTEVFTSFFGNRFTEGLSPDYEIARSFFLEGNLIFIEEEHRKQMIQGFKELFQTMDSQQQAKFPELTIL